MLPWSSMAHRLSTAVARKRFASMLRSSAQGQRIKLTRYDKTLAILIPAKDLGVLEDCEKKRAPGKRKRQP